jgi:hypothetical protein
MQDSASHLEGIEHLPKPKVEDERYDHGSNHDETSVPTFRVVCFVIESSQGREDIGKDGRWSPTSKTPCGGSNPSCLHVSVQIIPCLGEQSYLERGPRISGTQAQNLLTIDTALLPWDHCAVSGIDKVARCKTYMEANSAKEKPTAQAPNPARIDP